MQTRDFPRCTKERRDFMTVNDKLAALRESMKKYALDAYIIVTDDFHGSEYVGDYFKTRAFMSGFTGSAGTLVVLPDCSALWTDGRYFLQAEDQLCGSEIELMRMRQPGVPTIGAFLREKLAEGAVIGFDGRTVMDYFVRELEEALSGKNVSFSGGRDLVDPIWSDRPALSARPVWEVTAEFSGESRESKLARVRGEMEKNGADVLVLTALDEIAWLLNLRGDDVKCTQVFLSFMMIRRDTATLCVQDGILSDEISDALEKCGVTLAPYGDIYSLIASTPAGERVEYDPSYASYRIVSSVPAEAVASERESPVILMKAIKNKTEMQNMRTAHVRDGVAVTRFIKWLKEAAVSGTTELEASAKLEEFRRMGEGYIGPSFDYIIAYGAHGAIVHYEPTPETDIPLEPRGLCLTDTGGHYYEGTTDITRTVALGELSDDERRAYTLVLKSHLALGAAKFVHGVSGEHLDVLAREPMWREGLDYDHGTGHGVGYILSVHEGPHNICWRVGAKRRTAPLEEGMVVSNEPGLYIRDRFGIRHENLVLVREGERNEFGQFMYFEELTMVPFDLDAIDVSYLSAEEITLLNAYHAKVRAALSPYLSGDDLEFLNRATREISK